MSQLFHVLSLPLLGLLVFNTHCATIKESEVPARADLPSSSESDTIPIEKFTEAGSVTVLVFKIHITINLTSLIQRDWDSEHVACYRKCKATSPDWPIVQGTSAHSRYCSVICLAEYMKCVGENGAAYAFDSMAEAAQWLYKHPEVVQGALIIVGTAVFIVMTDGAGLVLLPYADRASQQLAR